MKSTEKLFDAFGELIYVIAMVDGEIQKEEIAAIEKKLSSHKWGKEIKWSFDYEVKKNQSVDDLYKKVISYCEIHGPEPEYQFLLDVIDEVARSNNGINENERNVMNNFVQDLTKKFREDIERINSL